MALAILFGTPMMFAYMVATRFTHPPWYYETARTPLQGLNFEYGSINWMNIKSNPLKDFNISFTDVEIDGPYGSTLRGWFIPAKAQTNSTRAVVAVHGAGLDRREFLKLTPILHNAGYNILLFDCREHGISTGSLRGFSYGIREHADVIAAVKYMKNIRKMNKIAVVGTSQGATSTILAASKEDAIDAVFLENPFFSFDDLLTDVINGLLNTKPTWTEDSGMLASMLVSSGEYIPNWFRTFLKKATMMKVIYSANEGNIINAGDVIGKLHQPLFLLHGTSDSLIPIRHTLRLFETAHEPKLLWVAEGCEHAAIYNKYPKEYAEKLTGFLKEYL